MWTWAGQEWCISGLAFLPLLCPSLSLDTHCVYAAHSAPRILATEGPAVLVSCSYVCPRVSAWSYASLGVTSDCTEVCECNRAWGCKCEKLLVHVCDHIWAQV